MFSNQKSIKFFGILSDLIFLNLCFILSAVYAQSFEIYLSKPQVMVLQFLCSIIWILTFGSGAAGASPAIKFSTASINILRRMAVQIFFAVFYIFFVKENLFTRNFIIYFSLSSTIFLLIKQFIVQKLILSAIKNEKLLKRAAIVGTGSLAKGFAAKIGTNAVLGYNLIGFISVGNDNSGNILGTIAELNTIIEELNIEEIIIALTMDEHELTEKVLHICDNKAVKAYIIPDYARYLSEKFSINIMGEYPVITVRSNPLEEFQNRFIKRFVDFAISFTLTVFVLSWLIPLIVLLIRLNSRGNAMFIQKRIGRYDKTFNCWKFRTMYSHPEGQKIQKVVNDKDQRITPIGRILRRTNIDEIPQIINVLTGSMSIVGPRPHAIAFHKDYEAFIEEIRLRHRVKPGITGWAQVHGYRGDAVEPKNYESHIKKRINADIWYIENWSLKLDLQIIFETIWQIFSGKNLGT